MNINTTLIASMDISFPSELGYEIIVRDAVESFAHRHGFAPERLEDLRTSLCEACINAIEHGNQCVAHMRVDVRCQYDRKQFQIEIQDQGIRPFSPPERPYSIAEKLAGVGTLRGMGLQIIAHLTDESGFLENDERGNCFRMVFYCDLDRTSRY